MAKFVSVKNTKFVKKIVKEGKNPVIAKKITKPLFTDKMRCDKITLYEDTEFYRTLNAFYM